MKQQSILVMVVILCSSVSVQATPTYLGDIDGGIYNGVGSVDDVYADPEWIQTAIAPASTGRKSFDVFRANADVFFTFLFTPPSTVTEAWLQVAIQAESIGWWSDIIAVENQPWTRYQDVGWLPISTDYIQIRTLNLGDILGEDLMSCLNDGQLNVRLADDTMIDYAVLSFGSEPAITDPLYPYQTFPPYDEAGALFAPPGWGDTTIIPAPSAILLSSIGVGLVTWLRRRRTI